MPAAIGERRLVVELGYTCAGAVSWLAHARSLYLLDCVTFQACRSDPALPWRRVAASAMRAHYSAGAALLWFEHLSELEDLPGLESDPDIVAVGVLKLALITLVAATIWIRSDRASSTGHWLYRHCVERIPLVKGGPSAPSVHPVNVIEDCLLGLACVLARATLVWWRFETLLEVAQTRVACLEVTAAALSLAHWVARHWLIQPTVLAIKANTDDGATWRLGGSSAIVDGSMAVMLVYTSAPLLVSDGGFDLTARLLTGVLVVIIALQRVMYACACCAVLLGAVWSGMHSADWSMCVLLALSVLMWLLQATAIAAATADLAATPMAVGLTRALLGSQQVVAVNVLCTLHALGIPQMLKGATALLTDRLAARRQ